MIINTEGSAEACRSPEHVVRFEYDPQNLRFFERYAALGARQINVTRLLCSQNSPTSCIFETPSGVPMFHDTHHLSREFAEFVGEIILENHPDLFFSLERSSGTPPEHDTGSAAPPRFVIEPTNEISTAGVILDAETKFNAAKLTGFGPFNPVGTWTLTENVDLDIPAFEGAAEELAISFRWFMPSANPRVDVPDLPDERSVTFKLDNTILQESVFRTSDFNIPNELFTVKLIIPADKIKQGYRLNLHVPTIGSPQSLGISEDDRKLGIVIGSVRYEQ